MQKKTASKGTYYRNPIISYAEADGPAEAESDEVDMSSAEVKLSFGHKIPKPEELKGKTFCKYHSSWSHNTNNCVVLRDVIQQLIDEKKLQFPEKTAMQVDSKPFPPPVINMVNAQLRAEYREERQPSKGKEPLAESKPVLYSRCECEIGRPRPLENKRNTSVSYRIRATPRPLKTFKPLVVRDDRWYHAQPGGSVQPLTKTQLRRMQRQAQPMVEGRGDPFFGHEPEDDLPLGISDEEYEGVLGTIEERTLAGSGYGAERGAGEGTQQETKEVTMNMVLVLPSEFSAPGGQTDSLDNNVAEEQLGQWPKTKEELLAVAFNEVIPRDEPNKYRNLKPLYISAHVEGVPISKVFVDCGAMVNILPC
ncbi:unnamed protein product, partial [Prunus brigantina]